MAPFKFLRSRFRFRSTEPDASVALALGLLALGRMATTDPLTGLRDRRGLELAAQRALTDCRRAGVPLSVVHLDLDDFKAINDNFGHAVGDRVLCDCAKYWTAMLDPDQILARVGGDEFILVLPGSDRIEAEMLLAGLRFGSPTPWSHGIAELRADDDLERCLLRADAALYAAKYRCADLN
jgi:GGDEF domain-containing protein